MRVSTGHRENTAAYETTLPHVSYKRASEYTLLTEYLSAMDFRHKSVSVGSIGVSVMGRDIPIITLGSKKSSPGVLYIGGFSGCDVISPAVLLRFVGDYLQFLEEGRRMYSASMPYLYEMRNIHIIPMLNPDGYSIRRGGVDDIPIAETLIKKNGGDDFTFWRYNARGADLMRVFGHTDTMGGGVSAINEPEAVALARYVSMSTVGVFGEIKLALSLIGDGCGIGYRSKNGTAPRSKTVGRLIERMSTIPLCDGEIARGSFSEWFIGEINRPAFDVRCIPDGGATTDPDDYVKSYACLREVLFSAPLLI